MTNGRAAACPLVSSVQLRLSMCDLKKHKNKTRPTQIIAYLQVSHNMLRPHIKSTFCQLYPVYTKKLDLRRGYSNVFV